MKISEKNKIQVNALQELLQKNYDAEKGYKQVMVKAENKKFKNWLQERAIDRHYFATQLNQEIRMLNETPIENSFSLGTVHRAWIDTKIVLANNSNKVILEECIRGEKASVKEYTEQLSEFHFEPKIKSLLTNQREKIEKALNNIKTLEAIIN